MPGTSKNTLVSLLHENWRRSVYFQNGCYWVIRLIVYYAIERFLLVQTHRDLSKRCVCIYFEAQGLYDNNSGDTVSRSTLTPRISLKLYNMTKTLDVGSDDGAVVLTGTIYNTDTSYDF